MLISSDIDQIILDRLIIFYDSIYRNREFRFYHTEVISVDRGFKSKKRLYNYTAYTPYRLMKHSDTTGDFFVLCKI
ncbi:hypothetical protein L1283_001979 [Sphingobacterium sp. HSC-15S19]